MTGMWLARVERGKRPVVFEVDGLAIELPRVTRNKRFVKITEQAPRAWMFQGERTSRVARLVSPGAAAIDTSPAAAIAAAMKVLAQYERATGIQQQSAGRW